MAVLLLASKSSALRSLSFSTNDAIALASLPEPAVKELRMECSSVLLLLLSTAASYSGLSWQDRAVLCRVLMPLLDNLSLYLSYLIPARPADCKTLWPYLLSACEPAGHSCSE